mmetsp:Transcript_159025/g.281900  ORF Transcript_159025/g.281900 Transcript_159025/m.281900 type:complete len:384 (+) Transcript_159025:138-1289(+)
MLPDLCDMPLPHGLLKQGTKQNSQAALPPGLGMSMTTVTSGVRRASKGALEVGMVKRVLSGQRTVSLASDTTVDPEALDSSETDSLSGRSGGPGSCEGSEQNEVYGRRAPADSSPEDFGYAAAMAVECNVQRNGKAVLNSKKVLDKSANGPKAFPKEDVPFECSPEAFGAAWRNNSGMRNTSHHGAGAGRRAGTAGYMSPGPLPFSGKQSQKRLNKDDVSANHQSHQQHPSGKFQTSMQPLPPGPLNRNPKTAEPALDADSATRLAELTFRNPHVDEKNRKRTTDTPTGRSLEKTQADLITETKRTECDAESKAKKQNKEPRVQAPPLPPKRVPLPADLMNDQLPIPGLCDKPLKIFMPELDCERTSLDPALPCKKRVPDWGF